MIADATKSVNYVALEKEWLSLTSLEEKYEYWNRMKILFSKLDTEQINSFFEQLQNCAGDITKRLELAEKKAEMCGFKAQAVRD